jgi:hypothetical protein
MEDVPGESTHLLLMPTLLSKQRDAYTIMVETTSAFSSLSQGLEVESHRSRSISCFFKYSYFDEAAIGILVCFAMRQAAGLRTDA